MNIPFTQYLLPDGRRKETSIDVGPLEHVAFESARACGFRMTCEILTNGLISMAIEHPELGDFDCIVCANGPDVPQKLSNMLLRFDRTKAEEWIKENS